MKQDFQFQFRGARLSVCWSLVDAFRDSGGGCHPHLGDAVRAECEISLRAAGLDPARYRRTIEDTIDTVYGP